MIPKIIHYCWFGGNKQNDTIRKCIASWKTYLPDYELIEWNESNLDIKSNDFMNFCFENKQWAYVADYARLLVLKDFGGIYLDTDMEVIRKFPSNFLDYNFFAGQEVDGIVSCGIIGAKKGNQVIIELLEYYDNSFILEPIPIFLNEIIERQGKIRDVNYYFPKPDVFYPMDYNGKLGCLDNSYTIHHWEGSWKSDKTWFYNKYVETRASFLNKQEIDILKEVQNTVFPSYKQLKTLEQVVISIKQNYGEYSHSYYNIISKYNRLIFSYVSNVFIHPKQFNPQTFRESIFNKYLKDKGIFFYIKILIKSIIYKTT